MLHPRFIRRVGRLAIETRDRPGLIPIKAERRWRLYATKARFAASAPRLHAESGR